MNDDDMKRLAKAYDAGYEACWSVFNGALMSIAAGVPMKQVLANIQRPKNPYEV